MIDEKMFETFEVCDCASLVYDLHNTLNICQLTIPIPEVVDFSTLANTMNDWDSKTLFNLVRLLDKYARSKGSSDCVRVYYSLAQFAEWRQYARARKLAASGEHGGFCADDVERYFEGFTESLNIRRGISSLVCGSLGYSRNNGANIQKLCSEAGMDDTRLSQIIRDPREQTPSETQRLRRALKRFPVKHNDISKYQYAEWGQSGGD